MKIRRGAPFSDRYMPEPNTGCWLWLCSVNSSGYGTVHGDVAHRASWRLHRGPVPEGMCVLHKCDVRLCVNPEHLFLGTMKDNMRDMKRKNRQNYARGERCGASLLNAQAVQAIRASALSSSALAEQYGVAVNTVAAVRRRDNWKHLFDAHLCD